MIRRLRLMAVGLGLALVGSDPPAVAQVGSVPEERFLDIAWQVERAGDRDAALVGLLRNHYLYEGRSVDARSRALGELGNEIPMLAAP